MLGSNTNPAHWTCLDRIQMLHIGHAWIEYKCCTLDMPGSNTNAAHWTCLDRIQMLHIGHAWIEYKCCTLDMLGSNTNAAHCNRCQVVIFALFQSLKKFFLISGNLEKEVQRQDGAEVGVRVQGEKQLCNISTSILCFAWSFLSPAVCLSMARRSRHEHEHATISGCYVHIYSPWNVGIRRELS